MANKKSFFMETTTVEVTRTSSEIIDALVGAGASQIACDYDANRQLCGLRWVMKIENEDQVFQMPARTESVYKILAAKRRPHSQVKFDQVKVKAQAERIAWRQLLRWVEAQLAMVYCGMAKRDEVFFSYRQVRPGVSIYQMLSEGSRFKQLSAASE